MGMLGSLLIALITVGVICYIISIVPFLPGWIKTACYVVCGAFLLIFLIRILTIGPMYGVY